MFRCSHQPTHLQEREEAVTITDDSPLLLLERDLAADARAEFAAQLEDAFNLTEDELVRLCDYFFGLDAPTWLEVTSFSAEPYFGSHAMRSVLARHLRKGIKNPSEELVELSQYYTDRYTAITKFCGQFRSDLRDLLARTVRDSVTYFELNLDNKSRPVARVKRAPQGMLEYALRVGFSLSFGELCRVAKAVRDNLRRPDFWTEGVELPIGESAKREAQVRSFFSQAVFGSLPLEILDLLAKTLRTDVTGFGVTHAPVDTIGTLVVYHSGALG